jgi:hypothetical protein
MVSNHCALDLQALLRYAVLVHPKHNLTIEYSQSWTASEHRLACRSVENPVFAFEAPERHEEDRKAELEHAQKARTELVGQLRGNLMSAPPAQRTEILRAILMAPGDADGDIDAFASRMMRDGLLSISNVLPLAQDQSARVARRAHVMLGAMFNAHLIRLANSDARAAAEADTNLYANAVLDLVSRRTTDVEMLAAQRAALNRQADAFALMLVRVTPAIRDDYLQRLHAIEKTLNEGSPGETAEQRGFRETLRKAVRAHPEALSKHGARVNPLPVLGWLEPNVPQR